MILVVDDPLLLYRRYYNLFWLDLSKQVNSFVEKEYVSYHFPDVPLIQKTLTKKKNILLYNNALHGYFVSTYQNVLR